MFIANIIICPAMDKILTKRCTKLERVRVVAASIILADLKTHFLFLRIAFWNPEMLNILRSPSCEEHTFYSRV